MREKEITSRDNPSVKRYALLAGSRREREQLGLFVTEGIKLTCEALEAGFVPIELFATEDALERDFERAQRVALACEEGFYKVSNQVADKLSKTVTPQGIFCVFRLPEGGRRPIGSDREPGSYESAIGSRTLSPEHGEPETAFGGTGTLLLCSLQDPGNLGTILRTASAFGVGRVVISDDCPDLFSPKVLRASMGGVFRVPVTVTPDMLSEIDALRASGTRVFAAALHSGAISVCAAPLDENVAVVIGNEGAGLPGEVIDRCDGTIIIPMERDSESLNAATAASVILWEMYRRAAK